MITSHTTLIEILKEMSTLESDNFKSRAYAKAAQSITENVTTETWESRKTFNDLPGIGQSINSTILAYRETGVIPAKLTSLREIQIDFIDHKLYKVRKSFISKRIPLERANNIFNVIEFHAKKLSSYEANHFTSCGSLRRGSELVADIDILIDKSELFTDLIKLLMDNSYYTVLVEGPQKVSFLFNNIEKTQLDITLCTPEEFPFALLHFTGSKEHNIKMRNIARSKGLSLSQHGLRVITNRFGYPINQEWADRLYTTKFTYEQDIFTFLGIPFANPYHR